MDRITNTGAAWARSERSRAWAAGLRARHWLALWATAWLLLDWLASRSPPVDNAEQLSWVRSLEWGYYKHPPLPTALLWPLVHTIGLGEMATYLAAGLVTGGALLLSRWLTTRLCGEAFANLATLGTLCIGYYSHRLGYYNHDVVLLLCGSAAAACCWRAFADRSSAAWIGLGIALGLGALAKYEVALFALSVLAWWGLQQGWRDPVHRAGLLRATVVGLAIFSPHLHWLVTHDFQPVQYARANSLAASVTLAQCTVDVLQWIAGQAIMMLGPLLLGAALYLRARYRVADAAATGALPPGLADPRARAFLFCWGLLPLLAIAAIGLLTGAQLHRNWGTAFMPLTCAALMTWVGRSTWHRVRWREALVGFVAIQALLVVDVVLGAGGATPVLNQHHSERFSSQWVADQIGPAARRELGGDIRVIAGPQRLASVLSLRLRERPLVLIDGRHEISPWLPQQMASLCAILWVGGAGDHPPFESKRHEIGEGLWWAVEWLSADPDVCR